ncbi:MAG: FAD binding domain-containing protein, partial [Anaerolineales bacterium]|nr:FAD binding domain-containing protein [Anaerolineales bacterium]
MTPNDYYQPATVAEALALIDRYGDSLLILAGGTLAMPLINEGISNPEWVLSLSRTGLDTIQESADHVVLGAAVTMSQVIEWGQIHMLRDAAAQIGGWAVRNMATVGGN